MAPARPDTKRKPLVIFDLDGTLVDSREDIAASIGVGLAAIGQANPPLEDIVRQIGRPLFDIFFSFTRDEEKAEIASKAYRRHYFMHCADNSRLYPGVEDVLNQLTKTHLLAIATTKKTFMAVEVAKKMGFDNLFALIQGTDAFAPKPDPAILLHVLGKLDTQPEEAWMVGDTASDMLAAKAAGVRAIGVSWGVGALESLQNESPYCTIERMEALVGIVNA